MAPISGVSFGNEHLRGKKTVDIIWSLTYQDGPAAPYLICCSFFPTSLSLSSVFLFLPSFYFFFISCLFSSTSFLLFSFFLFFFFSFFSNPLPFLFAWISSPGARVSRTPGILLAKIPPTLDVLVGGVFLRSPR